MSIAREAIVPEHTIALLPWSAVIEDWIEPLGISLESFCTEFRGSWMFGYVEALKRVGVRTVLIYMSARVEAPSRRTHTPSGATLWVLPAPRLYRALRHRMIYSYGQTVREAFGDLRGTRRLLFPFFAVLRELALYLTTPVSLLAQVLRQERCGAILCQEYEYPRFDMSVLLGKWLRLAVFGVFQGGNYHHSHLERLLRPLSLRGCAGLIIASSREAERVLEHYRIAGSKFTRIFNPIDVEMWKPTDQAEARGSLGIPPGARVIAWHGRVALHKKGIDVLLKAWDRIRAAHLDPDLQLLLIGNGDDAGKLEQHLARMQGVIWINRFVNNPAELRRYLSAADVYAFPSRDEGFPVALIEAMACGLPVVAADADGVSDILEGGETSGGLMVPRDNPDALSDALTRVLHDEDWRRELGKRARARAETCFSLQVVGEQLRGFLFSDQLQGARTATHIRQWARND